jgi:hypothetical protein
MLSGPSVVLLLLPHQPQPLCLLAISVIALDLLTLMVFFILILLVTILMRIIVVRVIITVFITVIEGTIGLTNCSSELKELIGLTQRVLLLILESLRSCSDALRTRSHDVKFVWMRGENH